MSRITNLSRRTKGIILGIAAVAAVGAVAIPGTGANFSASDTGQVNVHTATLSLNLSDPAGHSGTFEANFPELAPGGQQTQVFYVTNSGSIPANVTMGQPITPTALDAPNSNVNGNPSIDYNDLQFGIDGVMGLTSVGNLPATINLGSLGAGQTMTVTLRVGLDSSAGNEWQNAGVGASVTVTLNQA